MIHWSANINFTNIHDLIFISADEVEAMCVLRGIDLRVQREQFVVVVGLSIVNIALMSHY